VGIKFKWGMRLYKATPITLLSSRKSRHVGWYRINVLQLHIASNFRAKVQIFSVDGYMWCLSAAWHDPVPNITTFNTMYSMLQPADKINSRVVCVLSYTTRAPTYTSQCAVICFSPTAFQCQHISFKTPACWKFKMTWRSGC